MSTEEEQSNTEREPHAIEPIYLYQWIDCCDEYNKWYEAQVIDISASANTLIKVHYKGWKSKFDTWVDLTKQSDMARVHILHTHTHKPPVLGQLSSYDIHSKCDCLDSTDKWYEASIVEISENNKLIRIHYDAWEDKYNEWLNKDSYRIAPLHTMTTAKPPKPPKPVTNTNTVQVKPKYKRTHSNPSHSNASNTVIALETEPVYDYKKLEPIRAQTETEIKNEENDDIDTETIENNDSISQEQRDKNKEIQQKYLQNFKPSLRDEQQFESKLESRGLQIESMGEDGNCLFRSISHQMYGKQEFHMIVRQKCVAYLQSEYEYFGSYVPGGHDKQIFNAYCHKMSCNGIWGDNLEIQAFSEIYGRSIEIYAYDDKPMKTFSNNNGTNISDIPIRLSYHCNSHYNSIINPQTFEENIINPTRVGQIEDEKIRLSYLRSTHASEQTLNISDTEFTELQLFNSVLAESRKNFNSNGNDESNKQLDSAIQKSLQTLAEYENEKMRNAVKESIVSQEQRELAMALKKSQYDFNMGSNDSQHTFGDNNQNFSPNNNFNDSGNNLNNNFNANDTANNHCNNVIKILVDKGYSIEQATMAYSVFEPQKNQISPQIFVQRMIEYIENTKKATMFGYQNFYNLQ